ncbi:MAG TPA: protein phosphatase 2C domain-containing protein [Nocardioides sp.]
MTSTPDGTGTPPPEDDEPRDDRTREVPTLRPEDHEADEAFAPAPDDTAPRPIVPATPEDEGYTEIGPNETTGEVPAVPGDRVGLHLDFSAVSDVGRVRKDNQDSGYAGPHLLAVCDGVGGAARGDVASSTAIGQLRKLDDEPGEDLLGHVAGGLLRAHNRIGELVDDDPSLNGTSTTATIALFDGARLGIAHVGDSRAYLVRSGEITQLTKDHTFVQSLIDEGRITEAEARTHPHRNLILKALDGVHETDPDLFVVDIAEGDRLLLCSDGACGVLDDDRLNDILGTGTPDFAAIELVRASLEAGSTDNVTCVVADVTRQRVDTEPLLVGAAADLPRRSAGLTGLFRGHRSGDTGELEPVEATIPPNVGFAIPTDPIDPEAARYAPLPPRRFVWVKRFFWLVVVAGLLAAAAGAGYGFLQGRYYVGVQDGEVVVFRGFDYSLAGFSLQDAVEGTDITLDDVDELSPRLAAAIEEGLPVHDDVDGAKREFERRYEAALADAAEGTEGADGSGETEEPPGQTPGETEDMPSDPTSEPTTDPTAELQSTGVVLLEVG